MRLIATAALALLALLAPSGCADAGRMPWESARSCTTRQQLAGQSLQDAASLCAPIVDAHGNQLTGVRPL